MCTEVDQWEHRDINMSGQYFSALVILVHINNVCWALGNVTNSFISYPPPQQSVVISPGICHFDSPQLSPFYNLSSVSALTGKVKYTWNTLKYYEVNRWYNWQMEVVHWSQKWEDPVSQQRGTGWPTIKDVIVGLKQQWRNSDAIQCVLQQHVLDIQITTSVWTATVQLADTVFCQGLTGTDVGKPTNIRQWIKAKRTLYRHSWGKWT